MSGVYKRGLGWWVLPILGVLLSRFTGFIVVRSYVNVVPGRFPFVFQFPRSSGLVGVVRTIWFRKKIRLWMNGKTLQVLGRKMLGLRSL
jgi:hypothetical protein